VTALIALLKQLRQILHHWWSEFTLQTKLMAIGTLAVSLLMSGLTFWAVNSIQQDARIHDTRFGRDLGVLLATNVTPMIGENHLSELAQFSQRFYRNTSNVRYMLFADANGDIYFGIPYSQSEVQNSLTIRRRMQLPDNFSPDLDYPMVRQHLTPDGEVTDVFVPINYNGNYLGVLAIGTNPNPTVVTSSHLTRDVTIAVFVSIWVMVILGAVFNALTITKPIKELLVGVKNIAAGNFKQRIDLPLGGELGELILNFNEMAERLESYEEQNIEEMTAEKAKLETLVSTIADGAILLDRSLNVVLVNPTARKLFGWDNDDTVLGQHVLEKLPEAVQGQLSELLDEATTISEEPDEEELTRDREGAGFCVTVPGTIQRTLRIWLTTVLDQARENLKGIAITVQDITRETELNEAKSQFISNVSHELRTPLFNIKSFIETLHEYGEDLSHSERQEFLETANRETDRLTRLVNDVLDLSRLESGKRYHFDAVDLSQNIEQTLRTHQLNARDKGIELQKDVEPELPPVVGNYDLLLQVFNNLLGNSLKFTENGGKVVIRAYQLQPEGHTAEPTHVRIEVADTGIGIAPEDQQAIFDRFYRVENRVHTLEGTGLGLSIVRNIIDKHQSRINLSSEVGVGTTFSFDLPIYHADAYLPEPSLPQSFHSPSQAGIASL